MKGLAMPLPVVTQTGKTTNHVPPQPRFDAEPHYTPDSVGEVAYDPDEVVGQSEAPPVAPPREVDVNVTNRWLWTTPKAAEGWDPLTVPIANAATNPATQVLGAHPLRRAVTLYNSGAQVVFVGKAPDVSSGGMNTFALPVGASLTIEYRGAIYATQTSPGTAGAQLSVSPLYEVG